ncbi:LAO/AO transport system kinase [Neobacillus niacini]|jgi:LAO/AO transport system kinase|uniref:methylmalonyl Co-A mutase-associated GTPase MeaB n=1 Tax=Neobacillus niacini TaxID=86668 RepID=UPI0027888BE8|nr:methylmalonyl Co-A mutase-associated GTPase MeaB [Neobacillus niacini]MDQ1002763.1 LAO/AO transport system kinase [Neobacillus niacini]
MTEEKRLQSNQSFPPRRKHLSVDEYVQGVINGNRAIIAQAITLVESNLPKHMEMAQNVLKQLIPYTGKSIRIGFTGVPGAGKSTLIESFGMMLCEQNHRVAVLAVDPTSSVSKGSILGDKTRMEQLSRHPDAYVRPSPSSGTLGGVTRKSRETLLICEAAGYDVIIVETVGVGQSEITVRSMVDFFLVIMLTGAGDELQGMKKGVIELADAIFINKADGANQQAALNAKVDYNRLLHFLQPATVGWETKAFTVSALTGEGVPHIWDVIKKYKEVTSRTGVFEKRRKEQMINWVHSMIEDQLKARFYGSPLIKKSISEMEKFLVNGQTSPTLAVQQLFSIYDENGYGNKKSYSLKRGGN